MFDTMTMTKAVGALCGSLLVLLLGNWAASALYSTAAGGHGDEEHAQAYVIDTGAAPAESGADEAPVDVAALMATADAAAGEKVFGKCKACHKLDGKDGTGPHLNNVVGRQIASIAGFNYSTSMAAHSDNVWDEEHLFNFLKNPKAYAANTKMSFAGLPKEKDRVDLIAYLETQK